VAHTRLTSLLARTACLCATAVVAMASGVGGISLAAAGSCPNANLTPQAANIAQVRAAVLCLINQEREHHGESALVSNAKLTHSAEDHSQDMARADYFSHTSPNGETPLDRMRASGYISDPEAGYMVGENIAWGTLWLATPQAIVEAWMGSPGHRANILDASYRETGIGVVPHPPAALAEGQAGAIYTQDFGAIVTARRSSHGSAEGSGGITSAAQTSEQRSNTHNGSSRRKVRHRHRVRARHRARHRRAARRAGRARAHQRSRRRRREAGR
jgi:uncharacterized protein YkwD